MLEFAWSNIFFDQICFFFFFWIRWGWSRSKLTLYTWTKTTSPQPTIRQFFKMFLQHWQNSTKLEYTWKHVSFQSKHLIDISIITQKDVSQVQNGFHGPNFWVSSWQQNDQPTDLAAVLGFEAFRLWTLRIGIGILRAARHAVYRPCLRLGAVEVFGLSFFVSVWWSGRVIHGNTYKYNLQQKRIILYNIVL